mgnify:CR=1 FL=1
MKIYNKIYYTFEKDWIRINNYIPKNKVIWEAFSNGEYEGVDYLKSICKEVITHSGDFFDNNEGECVITNPPFSIKQQVLRRLKEIDKPFICILPTLSLQTKYMKEIFNGEIQVIMPTKKNLIYIYLLIHPTQAQIDFLIFLFVLIILQPYLIYLYV